MFSKIASFALLAAAGASAAAVPSTAPWTWQVTDFSSVCTAAICRYSFNVSAPVGPSGQPAFDAEFCSGTSVQGGFKSCGVVGVDVPGDVQTQEFNQGRDIGAIISVKYSFKQGDVTYTYTGNNSVAHTGLGPAVDFTIIPTEVTAVA
ncbi:hypothetical protein COCSADRAFT_101937 [Bipolaris sorokiniana ND90Pr]|uniref:Hypersensitive response-inducing protein n=1 Tax=Cochliobolus sativus (strain ND90Pr / ATCC 201652) TaxID=665912 RepID=M2SQU8_COCSN|nr:uncharacterized protein COCSADRAFT_101937 [Bipolaris sorokiniana ND90Pr]EMD59137.1 hypothetical protein COCSADRAFT_101937 [Bipolaris sorokiniana ND90Pr]